MFSFKVEKFQYYNLENLSTSKKNVLNWALRIYLCYNENLIKTEDIFKLLKTIHEFMVNNQSCFEVNILFYLLNFVYFLVP